MDPKENYIMTEEDANFIALRKSEHLARLIEVLGPTDFGFEEYHKFDHLIRGTIQEPDRSFTNTDEGREIRIFLKTYMQDQVLHQIVIGVIIPDDKKKSEVFVPILVFVTKDEEVVKQFATGKSISSPVLN